MKYTIKELRAEITAVGISLPNAKEMSLAIETLRGYEPKDAQIHYIISSLLETPVVPASENGRFTLRYVAEHCKHYLDIPLHMLTKGDSLTNLNNAYNLPAQQRFKRANGKKVSQRSSIATALGTDGHIGWVTAGTGDEIRTLATGMVRLFHREPAENMLVQ